MIGEKKLMKPHESPRIRKKSIRGDSGDSWPVWNRGISEHATINRLSCYLAAFSIFKVGNEMLLHISVFKVCFITQKLLFKTF